MPKVAEVLCKSLKTRLPTMADEVSGGLLEKAWFVSGDSAFRVQRAAARGVPVRFSRVRPRERFHFVVWSVPFLDHFRVEQVKLLTRIYLSVLKISATAFHCPFCFFHTTTYLPWVVVGVPSPPFIFSSNVPAS